MKSQRSGHISFRHAFDGLFYALRTQPNFKIHFILSVLAIGGGFYFQLSRLEMIFLVIIIVVGLAVEMANTAIESVTNLVTQEWRMEAKIAKDVSAGMMLLTAIGAVVLAIIIFTPHILSKFHF